MSENLVKKRYIPPDFDLIGVKFDTVICNPGTAETPIADIIEYDDTDDL